MLSLPRVFTSSTTPTCLDERGVLGSELMTVLTVSLLGVLTLNGDSSQDIHPIGYGFQMVGPYATFVAAEMVNHQADRYRTN